jgi:hypothetical protein
MYIPKILVPKTNKKDIPMKIKILSKKVGSGQSLI